jgi:hypothetical protein
MWPMINLSVTPEGNMSNKKYVVEYTTVNPVYDEGRAMTKAVALFIAFILVLTYVF